MEQSSERWKVLLGGVMMQLCIGGIYTWSLFNQPLVDAFGWERTEVYTAYSLIVFIFAFVTIFSGRLKAVRELGSERRETVRSLSVVGVGSLRGAVLSTRGPGWTYRWCTSCSARSIAG